MKELWSRGRLFLIAAVWLLGSVPSMENSRVYAETAEITPVQTLVNINTASAHELQAIAGIGPALAGRIISYRSQFGLFERLEELQNVTGIGPIKFEKMKTQITI